MKAIPVLAVAAVLLTGCSISPAATNGMPVQSAPFTTQAVHRVGEVVEVASDKSRSRVTIVSAGYSAESLSPYSSPRKGGYLVLEVLWETVDGTAEVNPLLFNAKDASGVQQGPQLGLGADGLAAASVPAGERLRGKVVFDTGAGPWVLTMGALTEDARWTIQP